MLDGNFRIGDTNSIAGVYQLQAAISVLAGWVRTLFEPWFFAVMGCAAG